MNEEQAGVAAERKQEQNKVDQQWRKKRKLAAINLVIDNFTPQ